MKAEFHSPVTDKSAASTRSSARQTARTGWTVSRLTSSSCGQPFIGVSPARAMRTAGPPSAQPEATVRHKHRPLAINRNRVIFTLPVRRWTEHRPEWMCRLTLGSPKLLSCLISWTFPSCSDFRHGFSRRHTSNGMCSPAERVVGQRNLPIRGLRNSLDSDWYDEVGQCDS